jgi:hypothetical protein
MDPELPCPDLAAPVVDLRGGSGSEGSGGGETERGEKGLLGFELTGDYPALDREWECVDKVPR